MSAPSPAPAGPGDAAARGDPDSPSRSPGGGPDPANDWALRGATPVEHDGRRCALLGRWVIVSRIAAGGMGTVYRAVHRDLGTQAAVKVLHPTLTEGQTGAVERFLREARLAAQLRSDHLVSVLDVARDEPSGAHYLVMDFVSGSSARQWIEEIRKSGRPVPERTALDIAIAATQGLAAAHAQGVVHRDVKPANILVPEGADGRPSFTAAKLSDLGLARRDDGESGITITGHGLGTPGYMPPEQAKGASDVGRSADVFAMGATLYALLTGDAPFTGATAYDAISATVECRYRPLASVRPDVSAATAALVARCLAMRPEDRFADAGALLAAMERVRDSLGDAARESAVATQLALTPAPGAPHAPAARPATPADAPPVPPAPSMRRLIVLAVVGALVLGALVVLLAPTGGGATRGSHPREAILHARGPCGILGVNPVNPEAPSVRKVPMGGDTALRDGDVVLAGPEGVSVVVEDDRFEFGADARFRVDVARDRDPDVTILQGSVRAHLTGDAGFGTPLYRAKLPTGDVDLAIELTAPEESRAQAAVDMNAICTEGAVALVVRTAADAVPGIAVRRAAAFLDAYLNAGETVSFARPEPGADGEATNLFRTQAGNRGDVELRMRWKGGVIELRVSPGVYGDVGARGAEKPLLVRNQRSSPEGSEIEVRVIDGKGGLSTTVAKLKPGDEPFVLER